MSDLTEIQSSQSIKLAGADPSTGVESFWAQVDSHGTVQTGLYTPAGSAIDLNFGAASATTIRVAALLGNATGAAAFGAGTTSAQVLRVVLPTDQTAIPVSQSGAWTVKAQLQDNAGTAVTLGQKTMANSIPVVIASDQTPYPVSSTSTQSSVASATSDTTLLASNPSRKGFSLYNDSTKNCFVLFSSGTSSSSNFSTVMLPGAYYESPHLPLYTGVIKGIWVSANGNMRVMEYT